MDRVNLSTRQPSPSHSGIDPVVLGTAYCMIAATGYAAANICLRDLAVRCDQIWVVAVKEAVAVAAIGPWLLVQAWRGRLVLPGCRALLALAGVGLLTQLVGNLPLIWAFGVVGLTVALPIAIGVSLAAGALLGRVLLGEGVSIRSAAAIAMLIAAVILLSMSAGRTNESIAASADVATGVLWVALGVGAACLAGVVYALVVVVIRRSVTGSVSPTTVVMIITGMGVLSLGPLSLWRHGVTGLLETPTRDFSIMLISGVLNLIAFLALTHGLRRVTVIRANVLGASQIAMCAVAGLTLFHEPASAWLILGVLMTMAGMVMIDRPQEPTEV